VETIALIATAVVWAAILLALSTNLSGRWPRDPHFRWKGGGLLLLVTEALISAFANYRKWPPSRLHNVARLEWLLILAAILCLLVWVRRRRADSARGDSGASGPGAAG